MVESRYGRVIKTGTDHYKKTPVPLEWSKMNYGEEYY